MEPLLSFRAVNKSFPTRAGSLPVLDAVTLDIRAGEFVSIIGGSGCGKSTLLRLAAGLEFPSTGEVRFVGEPVTKPGPDRSVVFQDHRLLPWLTVSGNIAFALADSKTEVAKAAIAQHIDLAGLAGFENHYPHQLSGGMAQRVALARALVCKPAVLLLDEPFGALDALTRIQQQQQIARIWQREQVTTILVTHDIDEAIFLSDRVVVFTPRPGSVRCSLAVPIPRPRPRSSPDFAEFRRVLCRELFGEEEALVDYVI